MCVWGGGGGRNAGAPFLRALSDCRSTWHAYCTVTKSTNFLPTCTMLTIAGYMCIHGTAFSQSASTLIAGLNYALERERSMCGFIQSCIIIIAWCVTF